MSILSIGYVNPLSAATGLRLPRPSVSAFAWLRRRRRLALTLGVP